MGEKIMGHAKESGPTREEIERVVGGWVGGWFAVASDWLRHPSCQA